MFDVELITVFIALSMIAFMGVILFFAATILPYISAFASGSFVSIF